MIIFYDRQPQHRLRDLYVRANLRVQAVPARSRRRRGRCRRDGSRPCRSVSAGSYRPTVPTEPWDDGDEQPSRRVSTTAGLPSFTYDRSVMHNVTGSGEEAATCSVCLGAFQTGETVRLLPVCLHLYHVECIDPWLDAHSTCPICRSGTDPTADGRLHPPV